MPLVIRRRRTKGHCGWGGIDTTFSQPNALDAGYSRIELQSEENFVSDAAGDLGGHCARVGNVTARAVDLQGTLRDRILRSFMGKTLTEHRRTHAFEGNFDL